MRKLLPVFFALLLVCGAGTASAQMTSPSGNLNTQIAASVGQYYLSVSGYASPYASVVMTADGIFVRAAVADQNGDFYISQVLIKAGFSGFCLETVDYKRLGSSTVCFSVPPATGNITMNNLFLPPTIGLAQTEVPAGSNVVVFGYTMPGAEVTLYVSGKEIKGFADSTGYYSVTIKDLKVGNYQLYAKAEYLNKESLTPTKKVSLRALSWWEQLLLFLKELWSKFIKFLTSVSLGPLWIGIPILILIIILLIKLWPEKFTFLYENQLFAMLPFKKKGKKLLHHAWWIGY